MTTVPAPQRWSSGTLIGWRAGSFSRWVRRRHCAALLPAEGSGCGQYLGVYASPGRSGAPVRAGAGAGMWLWEDQGGLLGPFSFVLVLLLVVTRSPFNACVLTGSLYILLRFFSFEPVPSRRALQVLKPRDRVSAIAHRGGSHDAPENTLAAIRQVSPAHASGLLRRWHLSTAPRPGIPPHFSYF